MLIQGVDALQFKVRLGDDNDSKVDRPENLFEQIIEWRRCGKAHGHVRFRFRALARRVDACKELFGTANECCTTIIRKISSNRRMNIEHSLAKCQPRTGEVEIRRHCGLG
jgi:hypothetical protein